MLLIGSRAIRYHFPGFREPIDWDLVATSDEIAELDRRLPRQDRERIDKAHYRLGNAVVEVANGSVLPYWGRVLESFAAEPTIVEPTLGSLHVAPAGFLLLTKQCGLIYPILHWHKNLEDLYFLRERVPHMPEHIASLVAEAVDDSRRMFLDLHQKRTVDVGPCHPDLPRASELHRALHARLVPEVGDAESAWRGFPEVDGKTRLAKLRAFMAEETLIVAAEQYLYPRHGFQSHDEDELVRWALRMLCIGRLPESFRYFLVNHYREVRDLIPKGWLTRAAALGLQREVDANACSAGDLCAPPTNPT
jgi:hypothetical protein